MAGAGQRPAKRSLFVLLVFHHHRTNLHGQTEQVDEPVSVLVVVKPSPVVKEAMDSLYRLYARCRACRDDIALYTAPA